MVQGQHTRERHARGPRAYALDYMPRWNKDPNSLFMLHAEENAKIREVRADCFYVLAPTGFYKAVYNTTVRVPEIWIEVGDDNCRFRMVLWDTETKDIMPLGKALWDSKNGLFRDSNLRKPLMERYVEMKAEDAEFEYQKEQKRAAEQEDFTKLLLSEGRYLAVGRETVMVEGNKKPNRITTE